MLMEKPPLTTEISEIQRRMAQIRHDMHHEVQGAVRGAQSLTDWRSVVRNRPWLSLSIAVAVGYLIVPRRQSEARTLVTAGPISNPVSPPTAMLQTEPSRWSSLKTVYSLLAPVAVRAAQNYALQHLERCFRRIRSRSRSPRRAARKPGVRTGRQLIRARLHGLLARGEPITAPVDPTRPATGKWDKFNVDMR